MQKTEKSAYTMKFRAILDGGKFVFLDWYSDLH